MDNLNGKTTIPDHQWCEPDHMIATDATLQGLGWICHKASGTQVFHCNVPKHLEGTHIGVYEMLAILVGLRTWANYYKDKRILIQCDNSSCVSLLNTCRCWDNQMLSIARNIWMTCAKNNIQLKVVHIQGVDNRIPDILSRWQSLPSAFKQLKSCYRTVHMNLWQFQMTHLILILHYNFRICMESIKDKNEDRPESSFPTRDITKPKMINWELIYCFVWTSIGHLSQLTPRILVHMHVFYRKNLNPVILYLTIFLESKLELHFSNTMLTTCIHLQWNQLLLDWTNSISGFRINVYRY